jgi:hypothetical protein
MVYEGGAGVYESASWELVRLVSQLRPTQWRRIIRRALRYATVDVEDVFLDDNGSDLVLEDGEVGDEDDDNDSLFFEV